MVANVVMYAAIPLSIDHKPDRSDERERIEQAGGFIIWAGNFVKISNAVVQLAWYLVIREF